VPETVLDDETERERPVRWLTPEGKQQTWMAHAWMTRIDRYYYQRMFPGQKEYHLALMREWGVSEEDTRKVCQHFDDMEPLLTRDGTLEELEAEWDRHQDAIHELVEAYRPATG